MNQKEKILLSYRTPNSYFVIEQEARDQCKFLTVRYAELDENNKIIVKGITYDSNGRPIRPDFAHCRLVSFDELSDFEKIWLLKSSALVDQVVALLYELDVRLAKIFYEAKMKDNFVTSLFWMDIKWSDLPIIFDTLVGISDSLTMIQVQQFLIDQLGFRILTKREVPEWV